MNFLPLKRYKVNTLGVNYLKKHALLHKVLFERSLARHLQETSEVLAKFEQAQTIMVAETYSRMGKNLLAVQQEFSVKNIDLNTSDSSSYLENLSDEDRDWMVTELEMLGISV